MRMAERLRPPATGKRPVRRAALRAAAALASAAHLLAACAGSPTGAAGGQPSPSADAALRTYVPVAAGARPGGAQGDDGLRDVIFSIDVSGDTGRVLDTQGQGYVVLQRLDTRQRGYEPSIKLVFSAGSQATYRIPPGLYDVVGISSAYFCPTLFVQPPDKAILREDFQVVFDARISVAGDSAEARFVRSARPIVAPGAQAMAPTWLNEEHFATCRTDYVPVDAKVEAPKEDSGKAGVHPVIAALGLVVLLPIAILMGVGDMGTYKKN